MTFFKKPADSEILRNENTVVGYYQNMAIVQDELAGLFFIRCEEKALEIGSVVENSLLDSITLLPDEEQSIIRELFQD